MGETPKRQTMSTFCWRDGGEIGEYGWMTEIDSFELDMEDEDEPREVLVEHWTLTSSEVRTLFPRLVSCQFEGTTDCEEDAVVWEQVGSHGEWVQLCEEHRSGATDA